MLTNNQEPDQDRSRTTSLEGAAASNEEAGPDSTTTRSCQPRANAAKQYIGMLGQLTWRSSAYGDLSNCDGVFLGRLRR